jgi:hypothetical protein
VARKELRRANDALVALKAAASLETLDACWLNIIRYLERCWNKTNAELKRNSKWQGRPARGQIERQRKQDPLLAYLCNARGADEHGIADITAKEPGAFGIGPAAGNNLYIERLTIKNGRITELRSPDRLRIVIQPAKFALAPVVNRGVTYHVPTSHEGNELVDNDPISIATAGIAFYSRILDRIETEFLR